MLRAAAAALLLLAGGGAPPARPDPPRQPSYSSITIRQQIVIRVPGRVRALSEAEPVRWKEGRGPRCVPARAIAGAALIGQRSVDFILRDRGRVRAQLESRCPALDYYYGFYISPNPDGMICADRDAIRSRVGGQCGIDRFRSLKMVAAD